MTFQKRLHILAKNGNLRVADFACWFDRPYHTVRGWFELGHAPTGSEKDVEHITSLLTLLETLLKKKAGLPVPILSQRARKQYVTDLAARQRGKC